MEIINMIAGILILILFGALYTRIAGMIGERLKLAENFVLLMQHLWKLLRKIFYRPKAK